MADLAQYDPIFKAAGEEWDVDPLILKAIATQESGGNRYARSSANAQGLMQIIPETQRHLGMTDPHDPVQSIYGGAKYLAEGLAAERENPTAALLFYHGGPGWRQSYGPESRGYVPAVSAHYQRYAKADTGTKADAAPAPDPAKLTDEQWLDEQAKTYPHLAGPNAATPAKPASATGGSAVPAAPSATAKSPADDPFSAALSEPAAAGGQKADAADPFTAALGKPGQEAPQPTADGKAQGVEPPGAAQASNWGIPGVPAAAPHPLTPPPEPSVRERIGNLIGDTAGRVGNALAGGYQAAPGLLTPEAHAAVESVPIVGKDLGFLTSAAGAGLKGVGALFSGAQAGVAAAGDPIGEAVTGRPGLGRGLAGMMEVAPEAMRAHPLLPGVGAIVPDAVRAVRDRIADNQLNAAAPLSPEFKARPLAPEMTARIGAPSEAGPLLVGPDGRPVPQSVGSAASREGTPAGAIDMTPEQAAAARTTADVQWLNKTNQPGIADPNEYIPGIRPTMAQREQTVQAAREQKTLRNLSQEVSQEERAVLDDHSQKRSDHYSETAGSEVTRANAAKVRDDRMDAALKDAFKNKADADATPIMQLAADIKASPDGRRPVVRNAVDRVTAELFDADGKLIADPEQLYGVRKHINDMLSKEAARDDPVSQRAASHLISLRDAVDGVIEPAAPGFKAAISNYATESGPIDAAAALQAVESKLHDTQGRMQFSKVHFLLRDIIEAQRPDAALSPWRHLSEPQMNRLKALHDDLKRVASAEDLARAYGSDSAQNFADAAKEYAKAGAKAGVELGANALLGVGLGSMVTAGARHLTAPFLTARTARLQTQRGMEMLHPDPAKYPTRNLLEPPT